jgi:HEAT repeat protein
MMQSAPTQRNVSRSSAVEETIAALRSFQHGDRGILDVIRCGAQAVPFLRAMLFERERSGLFQTRCRVVQALAALDAYDVLIEFLKANRTIADPVERVGEDAVINAAALALANVREQRVFELLLRLAQRSALTGVIGALGGLGRVEAIPVFIDALEEDASRYTAETALWKLGKKACPALLSTVDLKLPSLGRESESSVRRRRSALKLLAEMDRSRAAWRRLRHLMRDDDAPLAARACEIGLTRGSASERTDAVRRLIELLPKKNWILRQGIEAYLTLHFASAREVIAQYLNQNSRSPRDDIAAREQTEIILRRIIARATPAEAR